MKTHAEEIERAMSECKPYRELPADLHNLMIPPTIEMLMSGVSMAAQDRHGNITLRYTDGTTETAACPDIEMKDETSFFRIVSTVQDRARSGS